MNETLRFLTQQDYQQALAKIIQPLRPHVVRSTEPGLKLGTSGAVYDVQHAEIEALLRPLWGLAPSWLYLPDDTLQASYVAKISRGVDPNDPAYWGVIQNYDQSIVEMAALSLTLLLHHDTLWPQFSKEAQQNVSAWLKQALTKKIPKNNWTFFKVLIWLALTHCGEVLDRQLLNEQLNLLDQMYLGDGWYFDGKQTQKDYYVPFAFHYYGLICAKFMRELEPNRAQILIERATQFAQDYIYYFDADGEAVPYGRSLTYRFAQGAFFSALVFAEVEALPWGQVKQLLAQHLTTWMDHDIFTFDGRLSIGYHYENLVMAEDYNAPGSPYWALKTFLVLATPAEHPFWHAQPEPVVRETKKLIQLGNQLLIQARSGQHVLSYPAGLLIEGQAHAEAKYSKFVYSTKFGFSVPKAGVDYRDGAFDNVLAVAIDGQFFRPKRAVTSYELTAEKVRYQWSPFESVQITTEIYPFGEWHVRVHELETSVALTIREGGFSVPLLKKQPLARVTKNSARIVSGKLCSEIIAIEGYETAEITQLAANTSLFFPRTSLPYLTQKLSPGTHRLICLVGGCYEKEGTTC